MKLLIDLGNSRLKWASVQQGHFSFGGAINYEFTLPTQIYDLFWRDLPSIDSVWIAAVGNSDYVQLLRDFFGDFLKIVPEMVFSTTEFQGLRNAYAVPDQLGVDRWLAMIAAREQAAGGFLLVDAGTAVTIDLVNDQGQHQGGLILPGLKMSRQALLDATQISHWKQAEMEISPPEGGLGISTTQGVMMGTLLSLVMTLDQLADELAAMQNDGEFSLFITGGDALHLRGFLQGHWIMEDALVLKGLALVAQAPIR